MEQMHIPGIISEEDDKEDFHLGKPSKNIETYFDASMLPDAANRQRNSKGNQTYILHVIFPSQEELAHGLKVLSGGERKHLAKTAMYATVSSIAKMKTGEELIKFWEDNLCAEC